MKQAFLTVDLGFGDAGKGTITDWLCHTGAKIVVRYNGGCQCGHAVQLLNGRQHIFSQFGSGTFNGATTFLSRFVLVNPLLLMKEAEALANLGVINPNEKIFIDGKCLMTTPFHRAINRLTEIARGDKRHGSCGKGIGDTVAYNLTYPGMAPLLGDLKDINELRNKLVVLRDNKRKEARTLALPRTTLVEQELSTLFDDNVFDHILERYRAFSKTYRIVDSEFIGDCLNHTKTSIVFEGAQGVLLDEWLGFQPFTTWSTTTLGNAELLLKECNYVEPIVRMGIMRAYATRHGAGPFITEDDELKFQDFNNITNDWQGKLRIGWPDMVMARYATNCILSDGEKLDTIALTCVDRIQSMKEIKVCTDYIDGTGSDFDPVSYIAKTILPSMAQQLTMRLMTARPKYVQAPPSDLPYVIESATGVKVGIISSGPTRLDKKAVA